jgi:hypothetical protein
MSHRALAGTSFGVYGFSFFGMFYTCSVRKSVKCKDVAVSMVGDKQNVK